MNRLTPKLRSFAERLIACEKGENSSSGSTISPASLVAEKLGPHLATLMGDVGFRALLSRALVLAGAEVAWLRAVRVKANGSLEAPDKPGAQIGPDDALDGCVVLLARLLELLVDFIGENLTIRLAREAWPNLSLDNSEFGHENEK